MLKTPIVRRHRDFLPCCLPPHKSVIANLEIKCLLAHITIPTDFPFNASSLVQTYQWRAFLPPYYLSQFNVLEDHINLLQFGVIDDFEEADHIRMSDLLQNSNLPLGLVFWRHCDPAEPTLLRESLYDLDCYVFAGLKTACQFDLAVYTSAYLVDDLVLINQFTASNEVLLNLCFMCPKNGISRYTLESNCL
jgi:hypothetical protein